MKYINLGNSDLKVSKICLGTMTYGEQNSQKDAFEQMDYALDQGVNFFDTAELYSVPARGETQGSTEKIIGNYLTERKNRDKIKLATKVTGPGMNWIRDGKGYNGQVIREALEGSLRRLKTDYVDLYQLHWPNRPTYQFTQYFTEAQNFDETHVEDNLNEIIITVNELIKEGKIKHYGISNETAWGTMKYLDIARRTGQRKPISIQNEYSLLCRKFEPDLAEVAMAEKIDLLAWSPLSTGLLSGKYLNNEYPEGARLSEFQGTRWRQTKNAESAITEYLQIANKYNLNLSQMAIAFTLLRPFRAIPIIGATKMEQLKDNIEAINLKLEEETIKEINEVRKKYPIVF